MGRVKHVVLREWTASYGSVHFIRGCLHEPLDVLPSYFFKKCKDSKHICHQEVFRSCDAHVGMSLGSEIDRAVRGSRELSAASGFVLRKVIYDSTEFPFWGSEQCPRRACMTSTESYAVNPQGSRFGPKRMRLFGKMTESRECPDRFESPFGLGGTVSYMRFGSPCKLSTGPKAFETSGYGGRPPSLRRLALVR